MPLHVCKQCRERFGHCIQSILCGAQKEIHSGPLGTVAVGTCISWTVEPIDIEPWTVSLIAHGWEMQGACRPPASERNEKREPNHGCMDIYLSLLGSTRISPVRIIFGVGSSCACEDLQHNFSERPSKFLLHPYISHRISRHPLLYQFFCLLHLDAQPKGPSVLMM